MNNRVIKGGLYAYCIYTFITLTLHIVNYYFGFWGDYPDYMLYGIEIAFCIFLSIAFKRIAKNNKVSYLLKVLAVCNLLELTISITSTDMSGAAWLVFALLSLIRYCAGILFYYHLANDEKHKKLLLFWNGGVLLCALLLTVSAYFLRILCVLLVITFVYELGLILIYEMVDDSEERDSILNKLSNHKYSTKIKVISSVALILLLTAFFWLRYAKVEGKYELTTPNGEYQINSTISFLVEVDSDWYQYAVENRMPEWTGFHKEWFGLINQNTGEIKEPKYGNILHYDKSGIAWDYAGHFIDAEGNEVVKVPDSVLERISLRTGMINDLIDLAYHESDYGKYFEWFVARLNGENYFWHEADTNNIVWHEHPVRRGNIIIHNDDMYFLNHVAVFYSERKGAYGIINDKGEIVVEPTLTNVISEYDYEVMPVRKKCSGIWNAIDNQGNYLFEDERWVSYFVDTENKLVYFRKEDGPIVLSGYGENNYKNKLVCYDYNTENGDIILLETRDSLIVTDLSGNTIYKSEKYDDYYGYEGSKGTIEYLLAKQSSDDRWVFINCFGKPVLEKSFYTKRIMEKDGVHFVICDGYTSPDMTVLFFDGSIIETEYYYEDYIEEDGLLKIARKNDGDKEYNYLDLKGNLIFEEWIQE